MLILIKNSLAPPSVPTFVSGQNAVRCHLHSLLLSADFLISGSLVLQNLFITGNQCLISLCKKYLHSATDDGFAYCYDNMYTTLRNVENIRQDGIDEVEEFKSDVSDDDLNDEFVPPIPHVICST